MKLVWHAEGLIERDWFCYLLGDVVDGEIIDVELTCFDDETIHVINTNYALLRQYKRYFEELRARCRHIVLFHVADEWLSGGYGTYQYFDLVIRWNYTYLTCAPGIITIPLGYPNGTGSSLRLADQRQYAWSFVGQIKSSRIAMAKAFNDFVPNLITRTDALATPNPKRISKREFDAILADTVFSPCPMGNATIDTTRVYESLEFGCIPLVELRVSLDYYTNLLGRHPIPAFRNWSDARRFAEHAYQDKAFLLAKQTEISNWWQSYKTNLCAQVRGAIRGPSHASDLQHYAAKLRNRFSVVHEPLRIVEIVRHQTKGSLTRRLTRPVGPLKRIVADISCGKLATPTGIAVTRKARKIASNNGDRSTGSERA